MNFPEIQKDQHCAACDDFHYIFNILQHDALQKVPIFLFNSFENLAVCTSGGFLISFKAHSFKMDMERKQDS